MALVFLALNGVGLGHLVRATGVCDAIASAGERPVIFSQGIFPLAPEHRFPGKTVPSLWRADETIRRRVAADICSMAEISLPAVLVEDTHPNPLNLPGSIRRMLMVRPTTFAYLSELHEREGHIYRGFLLCDDAGSPTWPYSPAETAATLSWPNWYTIGPIYRRADITAIEEVRRRYGIADTGVCVFTMGGGGQHDPGDSDVEEFVRFATATAKRLLRLDPRARLLFVRGPYFPADVQLDSCFEDLRQEPQMPALLALARAAVIRSGFNTIWECIAGGTPFVPFVGRTFAEPNEERLARLRQHDLLVDDLSRAWRDEGWRSEYRSRCQLISQRFSGTPEPERLVALIKCRGVRIPIDFTPAPSAATSTRPPAKRRFHFTRGRTHPLIIRIDDVVSLEPTLLRLINLLVRRHVPASLEIVPYLSSLDDSVLGRLDPRATFEVGQHGYAHIPRRDDDGARYEFDPDSVAPTEEEQSQLEAGLLHLRATFPTRFNGGFSAPFDALPTWLPQTWRELGGTFVSQLSGGRALASPLPVVVAGTDIWDWSRGRPRTRREILANIDHQVSQTGYAGIVLHPRCLRQRPAQEHLLSLLGALERRRLTPTSLRELALE